MHIDRATIAEAAELNIVAWLSYPRRNRERGIARWLRQIPIRGMSCKLAGFDTEKMPEWAKVMLANIRMERECASTKSTNPRDIYDVWRDPYARTEEAA